MQLTIELKQAVFEKINSILEEKLDTLQKSIIETSESMMNDTKSSAGDKFETGREMMQLELNNKQNQLSKWLDLQKDLLTIKCSNLHHSIGFGSLVQTSAGAYFVSIAVGRVQLDDKVFYALSLASPIGKILKGKRAGDVFSFQGREIRILNLL